MMGRGFMQNTNESSNELIWKISQKYLSETSVIVEIAAYMVACVFNEDSLRYLPSCNACDSVVNQAPMNGGDRSSGVRS